MTTHAHPSPCAQSALDLAEARADEACDALPSAPHRPYLVVEHVCGIERLRFWATYWAAVAKLEGVLS